MSAKKKSTKDLGFASRAIHAGWDPQTAQGALNPPIYSSATFAFDSAEQGAARFSGDEPGMIYTRISNPTVAVLEARLASLEGGEAAVAFSSGMGAITSMGWTLLRPGDEVVTDLTLYGCTHGYFNHNLTQFGVKITACDFTDIGKVEAALGPKTRLVYFESPANPNMRIVDIAAVAELVHRRSSALVTIDNTYCSPYLQRPLELGADIVVHSATKYLNGHGDLIAGALISSQEIADRVRLEGIKENTGACMSAFDASQILRGLKTLPIRMDRHCQSAQRIAEFLESRPEISRVLYPGLRSHPQHKVATRQMAQPGGMIAFEMRGGLEAGRRFIDRLELITLAVSLGDAETLIQHPASMTHAPYTPEERQKHLISDGLIRLSVGLEDADDIIADLTQAF